VISAESIARIVALAEAAMKQQSIAHENTRENVQEPERILRIEGDYG
jgi:hypothetical protein